MRLSFVLPCYGRPARTKRMIECIAAQNMNQWEGFIIGDDCPDFAAMIQSEWFKDFVRNMNSLGNRVIYENRFEHTGGYGYSIINQAIRMAAGKYFIFLGNDDKISSAHFSHYLSGIEETNFDFAYFNSFVHPHNMLRMSQPIFGAIGHAELIIRTEFLQRIKPHSADYGHDWKLVEEMMRQTTKHKKVKGEYTTYYIMSVPGKTHDSID